MKLTTKTQVDAAKMQAMQKLNVQLAETALKQRGVIFANALRTVTPPHGKGATMASTAKANNEGIQALRKRIAQDIAGVDSVDQIKPFADPILTRSGKWIAVQSGTHELAKSKGAFGFIVVNSMLYKTEVAPMADPAEVYGKPVFRKGRARKAGGWQPAYVTAPLLRKFVQQRQKRAGRFISGWVPAYTAFGGKRIPAGFYKKLGGSGSGRVTGSGCKLKGEMQNEAAPEAAMAAAAASRQARAVRIAYGALKKNAKALSAWYAKKMKELQK